MGEESLCLKIMLEGDSFHEFLTSARYLFLVSPSIDALEVRCDGGEEFLDGFVAGVDLFGDWRWYGLLEMTDSVDLEMSLRSSVWLNDVGCRIVVLAHRWREKILIPDERMRCLFLA